MKKRLQKTLAIILTAALLLYCLPGAFAAEGFADMPDDWSTRALERAVENGLLRGSERDGALWLRPGDALTRAELAAVVNRAFGAERAAELTGVADVSADAWYAADMGKAAAMGTFKVDAAMRPEARITRRGRQGAGRLPGRRAGGRLGPRVRQRPGGGGLRLRVRRTALAHGGDHPGGVCPDDGQYG